MKKCFSALWKRRPGNCITLRWLALLVALLLPFSVLAQNLAANVPLIQVEVARHVANEHVQANNRPHQWRYIDHLVLYDVDGSPSAYAFVFARDGSRFRAPTDLRQHILATTASLPTKQGQQAQSSDDNDLFGFDDLATVITGATVESPMILRHFRGAPEFWIEAAKMETRGAAKQQAGRKAATHVIMVSPADFRLISTEGSPVVELGKQAAAVPFAASAETLTTQSKKTERISALRQQKQERDARARQRIDSMSADQKKRYEDALWQRSESLRIQWERSRAAWESKRAAGEDRQ